mmetsp:Transcript_27433/g.20584  ORF Transcript_27433/g.20584 Transcript_27433/m.20584 type:complete len:80 (+) Transcript_27433:28-267(+)
MVSQCFALRELVLTLEDHLFELGEIFIPLLVQLFVNRPQRNHSFRVSSEDLLSVGTPPQATERMLPRRFPRQGRFRIFV